MGKKITVANLISLVGAAVTVLFSFLEFFSFPDGFGDSGGSAWSGDYGAFATTLPAILAIVMLVWGIMEVAGTNLPDNVLTYNSNQVKGMIGIFTALMMVSWLLTDFGGLDKGIGFWGMLLGSLAMAVGAVMALLGKGTEIVGGGSSGDTVATAPPPPPPGMSPPPPPAP